MNEHSTLHNCCIWNCVISSKSKVYFKRYKIKFLGFMGKIGFAKNNFRVHLKGPRPHQL